MHDAGLASKDVDEWVRRALRENGTIYTIDEPLLRELRHGRILTQNYATCVLLATARDRAPGRNVARHQLKWLILEPSSLSTFWTN